MTAKAGVEEVGAQRAGDLIRERCGFLTGRREAMQIDDRQSGLPARLRGPVDGFFGAGYQIRQLCLGCRQVSVEIVRKINRPQGRIDRNYGELRRHFTKLKFRTFCPRISPF